MYKIILLAAVFAPFSQPALSQGLRETFQNRDAELSRIHNACLRERRTAEEEVVNKIILLILEDAGLEDQAIQSAQFFASKSHTSIRFDIITGRQMNDFSDFASERQAAYFEVDGKICALHNLEFEVSHVSKTQEDIPATKSVHLGGSNIRSIPYVATGDETLKALDISDLTTGTASVNARCLDENSNETSITIQSQLLQTHFLAIHPKCSLR